MSLKRTQNSILLLTTLGVYIGLLVAGGAAPQVLAHSATSRTFEITDEIEVKDELDDIPDLEALVRIFESGLDPASADTTVAAPTSESHSTHFASARSGNFRIVSGLFDDLSFASAPNSHFEAPRTAEPVRVADHVIERSISSPETSKLLVITRLPRAGLDALLAKDAK